MQGAPPIAAIMVTGKTVARYALARAAIQSFLSQDYNGKTHLFIINDNPAPLLEEATSYANVTEVRVPLRATPCTLGELRNVGLDMAADGFDYVVQWDDDDFSLPHRLSYQIKETTRGTASIFRWQTQYNLATGACFAGCGNVSTVKGFAGTMLFPATTKARFQSVARGEDTYFLQAVKQKTTLHVISNRPEIYLRLYHGHNTWPESHVMRRRAGSRQLHDNELAIVRQIVETNYPWAASRAE